MADKPPENAPKLSSTDAWLKKRLSLSRHPGTFGTGNRAVSQHRESVPGPQYYTRETIGADKPQITISSSAQRDFNLASTSDSPGILYDAVPEGVTSNEKRHVAFSFSQAPRFQSVSTAAGTASHLNDSDRVRIGDLGSTESSASHLGVGTETPKFFFGVRLNEPQRYFSPDLSLSESISPSPLKYGNPHDNLRHRSLRDSGPSFSLGFGDRCDVTKHGADPSFPAPGTYDIGTHHPRGNHTINGRGSALPFASRDAPMMLTRENEKVLYGRDTPGPRYLPSFSVIDPKVQSHGFGVPPPKPSRRKLVRSRARRGRGRGRGRGRRRGRGQRRRRRRGRGRQRRSKRRNVEEEEESEPYYDYDSSSLLRNQAPGPGHYSAKKHICSPSISLAFKEPEIEDIFTNTVRKARFIFGQKGIWSPGPKYNMKSTLGGPAFPIPQSGANKKTVVERIAEKKLVEKIEVAEREAESGNEEAAIRARSLKKRLRMSKRARVDPDAGRKVGPGQYWPKHHLVENSGPMITFPDAARAHPSKRNGVPGPGTYAVHPGLAALSRTKRSVVPRFVKPLAGKRGRPSMDLTGRDSCGPSRYFPMKSTLRSSGTRFGGLK